MDKVTIMLEDNIANDDVFHFAKEAKKLILRYANEGDPISVLSKDRKIKKFLKHEQDLADTAYYTLLTLTAIRNGNVSPVSVDDVKEEDKTLTPFEQALAKTIRGRGGYLPSINNEWLKSTARELLNIGIHEMMV